MICAAAEQIPAEWQGSRCAGICPWLCEKVVRAGVQGARGTRGLLGQRIKAGEPSAFTHKSSLVRMAGVRSGALFHEVLYNLPMNLGWDRAKVYPLFFGMVAGVTKWLRLGKRDRSPAVTAKRPLADPPLADGAVVPLGGGEGKRPLAGARGSDGNVERDRVRE